MPLKSEVGQIILKVIYWATDKINKGLLAFIHFIPPADRRLTAWTTDLMRLMLRHRAISLAVLIVLPALLFILGEDGLLDPLSDALDMFTELASNLPFDLLALILIPGAALVIGFYMFRRKIGFGEACRLVFYAIFARLFYLTVLAFIIMFFLQFTPLKADRRSQTQMPAAGTLVAVRALEGGAVI